MTRSNHCANKERKDINPKGLVPAIEHQGKAIYESLILCEFLEDAYPSYKPHLLPDNSYDRAFSRIWLDHLAKNFLPAFFRLLQAQPEEKEKQDEARQELYKALGTLAAKRKGPYFLGEEFSIVDVAIAPWVVRDYNLAEHRGYKREDIPNGWKEWADLLEQRDSVRKTMSVSPDHTSGFI